MALGKPEICPSPILLGMQRLLATAALLGLAGFGFLPACSPESAPKPLASAELRSRTEARLAAGHAELRKSIGHYGLVSEVSPEELRSFMAQVFPRRDGPDIVMGGLGGIELHGGGALKIIADLWRPEGRPARLSDSWLFVPVQAEVPLQDIYDSLRKQVFLPVPGVEPEFIEGQLPSVPTLARMRMRHRANGPPETSELDAFNALTLLLRYEADLDRSWTNRLGQRLSTRSLLDAAWDHYLQPRDAEEEFKDHSHLHLVEILLAYNQRLPPGERRDPNALKRRLLEIELVRRDTGEAEVSEVLGHTAESLGLLLSEPAVDWSPAEKAQVRAWLTELETVQLVELDEVPLQHLAHLRRGLFLIDAHADRLQ